MERGLWVCVGSNITVAGKVISLKWTYEANEGDTDTLSSQSGFVPRSHAGTVRDLLRAFSKADMMQ